MTDEKKTARVINPHDKAINYLPIVIPLPRRPRRTRRVRFDELSKKAKQDPWLEIVVDVFDTTGVNPLLICHARQEWLEDTVRLTFLLSSPIEPTA